MNCANVRALFTEWKENFSWTLYLTWYLNLQKQLFYLVFIAYNSTSSKLKLFPLFGNIRTYVLTAGKLELPWSMSIRRISHERIVERWGEVCFSVLLAASATMTMFPSNSVGFECLILAGFRPEYFPPARVYEVIIYFYQSLATTKRKLLRQVNLLQKYWL